VKTHTEHVYIKLGITAANAEFQAVMVAVDRGEVSLYEVTPDEAVRKVERLSDGEREVMNAMIADRGSASTNTEIAEAIGMSRATVKARMGVIFEKLGVPNRTTAGLVYLRAQHEQQVREAPQRKAS